MNKSPKAKKIDIDSPENQRIRGEFVAREVRVCFSYEMDAILRESVNIKESAFSQRFGDSGLPDYEQIENLYEYKCPQCGNGFQINDEKPTEECCGTNTEEMEQGPQEVFEWWIVSKHLYEHLRTKGEPVLKWGSSCFWGRTTTGQAISMDGVIAEICQHMQILDGQKYSWAKTI